MIKKYLEIGKIVNTHGIMGAVKVMPWCDGADFITEFDVLYLDKGKTPVKILNAWTHKGMAVLKLEGIDHMDAAAKLKNQILYLDRDDVKLAPGSYFIQDLIGLTAEDADSGQGYGKISDVLQTGANDVYVLTDELGKERLIPAIPDVIVKTDMENGRLLIRPLKGLFDDED